MTEPRIVTVYSDYKSPYAYLAKDLAYALEEEAGCRVEWLPYVLDIPSFLGSAELDAAGRLVQAERNAHQWRRVRYSYMDCRRQARARGLTIRGPQKIWNSSLAAVGMLFAKRQGARVFRGYHDRVFERFWRRELDIENPAVVAAALAEAGADTGGFAEYLGGEGSRELRSVQQAAEEAGVFGVPTFIVDGELYWGREHLADVRVRLRSGR
jgi:2-hydroxychromene-2-carboxylate isomerase